jgi:NADP-dependent 3-hydroxy acid dehydrogenase YdfG
MESSTNQKVAIVTGSSTGIGYETYLALARDGFILMLQWEILKAENIKSVATKESLHLQTTRCYTWCISQECSRSNIIRNRRENRRTSK